MQNQPRWTNDAVKDIYQQAFNDLIHRAHTVHTENHPQNEVEVAKLLSIKTGACPEDCGYCSQSGHHSAELEKEKLMDVGEVIRQAKIAKSNGAERFCMGAAWRSPPKRAMQNLVEMIEEVKKLGLQTCMTLGMLSQEQAETLKEAGLDFYNHNLDTSPSYYNRVVTTRSYQDRLDTVAHVRNAGIQVCCGGILGLGESQSDRIEFLSTLANLNPAPESVPINRLIPVKGTPLAEAKPVDDIELVRTIATARIIMPKSVIRLTAGRTEMSEVLQAMCFFAGANSVFIGEQLLTQDNPGISKDEALFNKLGIKTSQPLESAC